MTIKQCFEKCFKAYQTNNRPYSLKLIEDQLPVSYSADKVMPNKQMPNKQTNRCDYFVLCDCVPRTTGIYVIEVKGKSPSMKDVEKQLQSGADFVNKHLSANERIAFLPILVAKSIPRTTLKEFQKINIQLGGKTLSSKHTKKIKHIKPRKSLPKLTPK